jgi:hypothetical protein
MDPSTEQIGGRPWGGTWNPASGQLTFQFTGMSQVEALAVLRLAEHALIRQMTSGLPGRLGADPGVPVGTIRAPGLIARKVG